MIVIYNGYNSKIENFISPFMYNQAVFIKNLVSCGVSKDDVYIVGFDSLDRFVCLVAKGVYKVDMFVFLLSYVSDRTPFASLDFLLRNFCVKVLGFFNDYESYRFLQLFNYRNWFLLLNNDPIRFMQKCGSNNFRYVKMLNFQVFKYVDYDFNDLIFLKHKTFVQFPIMYYGSFRQGRVRYYKKYFNNYDIYLSTSKKNVKNFLNIGVKATFIDVFNWDCKGFCHDLMSFKASLYIEDVVTHNWYNYLSNRFYECLVHGVPMFFDVSCKNTVEKSGYPISDFWFVDSLEEILDKINSSNFDSESESYIYNCLEYMKKEVVQEEQKLKEMIKEILNIKILW